MMISPISTCAVCVDDYNTEDLNESMVCDDCQTQTTIVRCNKCWIRYYENSDNTITECRECKTGDYLQELESPQ